MREVKEGLDLDNLHTDHVMIRSELKYLFGAKIVDLKCRVFGCKTAPFPTVRVFRVVRPVATVRFRVEPNPEPTPEFGPVANTSSIISSHHDMLLELNVEGTRGEIFAASPIAIPMQRCTQ